MRAIWIHSPKLSNPRQQAINGIQERKNCQKIGKSKNQAQVISITLNNFSTKQN
jgi:hypothetical protein